MPFIETPHFNMHYEIGGGGKTVGLLLHGNFASWRWWTPILKNTPNGYRIYVPDLRGCGDSEHPEDGFTIDQHAEDIHHMAEALRLHRIHLVGHSLGACVALRYALNHPRKVKTITLVAPAPIQGRDMFESGHWHHTFANNPDTMYSALRMSERMGATRKVMHRALSKMMPTATIDEQFEALVDDAVRMSREAAVGHLQALNTWDVEDALHHIEQPVLIIGGQDDNLVSVESLEKAAEKLPNGRLIICPNVGHTPQLEHPQRFIRIFQKFTKQYPTMTVAKVRNTIRRLFTGMLRETEADRSHMCFPK